MNKRPANWPTGYEDDWIGTRKLTPLGNLLSALYFVIAVASVWAFCEILKDGRLPSGTKSANTEEP